MAVTDYPINHPLAVKLWSKKLAQDALKETFFGKFIGKTSDSLVQIKEETSKGAGDKITFGLRLQLTGDGVTGDNTLEGNEESLVTYSDSIYIDQIRHAVRSNGKMSEQRVPFSVREEARMALSDWYSEVLDSAFFNQLTGNTAVTGAKAGNNTATAPSSTRIQYHDGKTTEAGIASSGASTQMSLQLIDYAVERAKTASPAGLRPVKVGNKKMWVLFLHPYQITQLRTNTSTGQWLDIQKALVSGGEKDNPIFNGSHGVYNSVIIHESTRIPAAPNYSNVRRGVLCGAQAAAIAFGKDFGGGEADGNFKWVEKFHDYENQLGVAAASIFGLKKCVFNSVDFSTIVIPTQSTAAA